MTKILLLPAAGVLLLGLAGFDMRCTPLIIIRRTSMRSTQRMKPCFVS
jgi:hypothetical protein